MQRRKARKCFHAVLAIVGHHAPVMTSSTTAHDVAVDAALGYLVALHTDVQDCIESSHDPGVQRFDEAYDAPLPTLQQLTALFDVRPTLTRAFCVSHHSLITTVARRWP